MLYERLMRFIEFRCFLPKRMLFYRDGVSEDQFKEVRDKELPQIRRAFQKARDEASNSKQYRSHDDELQLTFIVAGKRHHTRFFARQPDDTYDDNSRAGMVLESGATKQALNRFNQPLLDHEGQPRQIPVKKNGNLKPGLIVDEVITRPPCDDTFDFFLQSHAALQGTARSAHYSVLVKGDLSVDQIQSLVSIFLRWTHLWQKANGHVPRHTASATTTPERQRASHMLGQPITPTACAIAAPTT